MKKQDKYLYPAVFTYEDGYEIAVTFPDLPGCATSGADESEALEMAKDALEKGINFSQALQATLMNELGINQGLQI